MVAADVADEELGLYMLGLKTDSPQRLAYA
jgi:hypothetical protein